MSKETFRSQRGIYVQSLTAEQAAERLRGYPDFQGGDKQSYTVALSEVRDDWLLVAIPDDMAREDFYQLCLWLLAGEDGADDFDDEDDGDEEDEGHELPPDAVIAVSYVGGDPTECHYALYTESDELVLVGRRDDGMGLWIDAQDDLVRTQKESKRYQLSVLDYLKERGVPKALHPGPKGFVLVPATRVTIDTHLM